MAITDEMRTAVLELYTAYFNRAADTDGVNYWLNEMDTKGWTVDTVAQSFADQTEYSTIYSGLSNTQITEKIYTNILGRSADAAGLAYWVAELDAQTLEVKNLVQAVVNAATEVVGGTAVNTTDKAIVDNKTEVSRYYYDNKQNETGVSLASVTGDDATVTTAKTTADATIEINAVAAYNTALATYNTAVTTAAASKAAAETAATTVSTTALANASLTAANTAKTDAQAVVAAATAMVTASAVTNSTTDNTTAAANKTSADSAVTVIAGYVTTATAAVSTAVAADAAKTAATVTSTATLTTEIDNLTGDSSNNLFIGDANSAVTADQIDGGAGTDIFRLYDGVTSADMPTLSNVEQIELVRFITNDLDLSSISALELLTLDDSQTGRTYTVADNVSSVIKNMVNGEAVTVAYAATETEATSTVDALGSTGGVVTTNIDGTGLTTINLVSSGTGSFVDLDSTGTITTLNISGTKALNLDATTETAITTINASGMTAGGLTLNINSASNTTITGSAASDIVTADDAVNFTVNLGAGDDVITVANVDASDTFNGGDGNADVIALLSADAGTVAGTNNILSQITNFEIVRITDDFDTTFDISKFGSNHLQLDLSTTAGTVVSGFTSGATLEMREDGAMVNVVATMTDATLSANISDTLNIKLNADIDNGDTHATLFDIDGIEIVNIDANDRDNSDATTGADDGYTIGLDGSANNNNDNLKTVTITGSSKLSYTVDAGATSLVTIDGSASTGELTISAAAAAVTATSGIAITGGSAVDTITGQNTNKNVINGGAGADNITLGDGTNVVIINSIAESKDDTVTDGGSAAGDTLEIADAVVNTSGTTANLIDLVAQTNSKLSATNVFDNYANGAIENVDLSNVTTTTKAVKVVGDTAVNTFTSGAGADVFTVSTGADVVKISATASIDGREDTITDFVRSTDMIVLYGDHGSNSLDLSGVTVSSNEYTLGATHVILTGNTAAPMAGSVTLGTTTDVFKTNGATIVASDAADYLQGGTSAQTITLGGGNNVYTIAAGESANGSEDKFTDFTKATDKVILTGSNSVAVDLGNVADVDTGDATYYEQTLGSSHVIFKFSNDDGTGTAEDMANSIQLGTSAAVFLTTADITAGDFVDYVQSGSSNQTIKLGAGNDVIYYNSGSSDATGTAESIDGEAGGTDTIVVAGGTTAVNFSDDTIAGFEVLELMKSYDLSTADASAQSISLTDTQLGALTVNASHNGTTGDTITLTEYVTAAELNATVVSGSLKLTFKDGVNTFTTQDALMTSTEDLLYVNGGSITGDVFTFDGSAENEGTFVVTGGTGADVITGGDKNDTFTGGSGSDHYNLGTVTATGVDKITDFVGGTDEIDTLAITALNDATETSTASAQTLAQALDIIDNTNYSSDATLFTYNSKTYIFINDATQAYDAATDHVIEITGYTGTIVTADFV